jgi:hypothetical protein
VSPSSQRPTTELARGHISAADTLTIELVEAEETPAVVIVRWPRQATVIQLRRFPHTAAAMALVRGRCDNARRDQSEPAAVNRLQCQSPLRLPDPPMTTSTESATSHGRETMRERLGTETGPQPKRALRIPAVLAPSRGMGDHRQAQAASAPPCRWWVWPR